MIFSRNNCVEIQDKTRKRNSSLDISELHRIINVKKPKSLTSSLSFKKEFIFSNRKYFTY
jgi:hypothetical protein